MQITFKGQKESQRGEEKGKGNGGAGGLTLLTFKER